MTHRRGQGISYVEFARKVNKKAISNENGSLKLKHTHTHILKRNPFGISDIPLIGSFIEIIENHNLWKLDAKQIQAEWHLWHRTSILERIPRKRLWRKRELNSICSMNKCKELFGFRAKVICDLMKSSIDETKWKCNNKFLWGRRGVGKGGNGIASSHRAFELRLLERLPPTTALESISSVEGPTGELEKTIKLVITWF